MVTPGSGGVILHVTPLSLATVSCVCATPVKFPPETGGGGRTNVRIPFPDDCTTVGGNAATCAAICANV